MAFAHETDAFAHDTDAFSYLRNSGTPPSVIHFMTLTPHRQSIASYQVSL